MAQEPSIFETAKAFFDSLSEVDHVVVGAAIGALGFLGKALFGRRRAKRSDALVEAQTRAAENESLLSVIQGLREQMEAQEHALNAKLEAQNEELALMHTKLDIVVNYVTEEIPVLANDLCEGARTNGCPLAKTIPEDFKGRVWVRIQRPVTSEKRGG